MYLYNRGAKVRLAGDTCQSEILGLDDHGYLLVQSPGGATSVHPDGNTYDMMQGLIRPKWEVMLQWQKVDCKPLMDKLSLIYVCTLPWCCSVVNIDEATTSITPVDLLVYVSIVITFVAHDKGNWSLKVLLKTIVCYRWHSSSLGSRRERSLFPTQHAVGLLCLIYKWQQKWFDVSVRRTDLIYHLNETYL